LGADDEITAEQRDEDGRVIWTLTRAHLARTRDWPIDLVVPTAALTVAVAPPPAPSAPAPLTGETPPAPPPWEGAAALAVATLVVTLRISRTRAREHAARTRERAFVPLRPAFRAAMALVLGTAAMAAALSAIDPRIAAMLAAAMLVPAWTRGEAE